MGRSPNGIAERIERHNIRLRPPIQGRFRKFSSFPPNFAPHHHISARTFSPSDEALLRLAGTSKIAGYLIDQCLGRRGAAALNKIITTAILKPNMKDRILRIKCFGPRMNKLDTALPTSSLRRLALAANFIKVKVTKNSPLTLFADSSQ